MSNDLFLSYKHGNEDAPEEGIVTEYILRFKLADLKVWAFHDQKGNISDNQIKEAVRNSKIFVLFLTKNVLKDKYVILAVRHAVKINKKIVLLCHPDTEKADYCSYDDYTANCPEDLKFIFADSITIKLERSSKLAGLVVQNLKLLVKASTEGNMVLKNEDAIYVKTLTKGLLSFPFDPSMSVIKLKLLVSDRTDEEVHAIRLIFSGRELEDLKPLRDYGITPESTIHVHEKLLKHIIFVRDLTGKTFELPYRKAMTIMELKKLLSIKNNLKVAEMRLIFAGKDMKNDRTVEQYGITPESTLHVLMKLITSNPITLFIRTLERRTLQMHFDENMSIGNMKAKISQKTDVQACQMRLVFAGVDLVDDRTIRDYKITKDSTLHMFMRLTGC